MDLPFPVLLGRDAPAFENWLRATLHQQTNAAESDDEVPSPSNLETQGKEDSESDVDAVTWEADECLRQAQEADPMLTKVQEELIVDEGQVLDARRAGRNPRFVKEGGLFWRVTGPGEKGEAPR